MCATIVLGYIWLVCACVCSCSPGVYLVDIWLCVWLHPGAGGGACIWTADDCVCSCSPEMYLSGVWLCVSCGLGVYLTIYVGVSGCSLGVYGAGV